MAARVAASRPNETLAPCPSQKSPDLGAMRTIGLKGYTALVAFRGPFLILLAEAFSACMAATTRALEMPQPDGSPGMHTLQILFARFSITTVLCLLYMWWKGIEDAPLGTPEVRKWLVLRGCAGFGAVFGFYYSLQYLPIAEAIIIIFITPILTGFASSLFLGEPFSKKQFLVAFVCFIGIIVVADPLDISAKTSLSGEASSAPDGSAFKGEIKSFQRFSAVSLGLLSDFAAAGAFTFIRLIGNKAHTLISVNYYAVLTTILSAFILVLPIVPDVNMRLPKGLHEWLLLIGIGVFGFFSQYLMTVGLVIDKSSKTTNMIYSQIVFGLILDWAVWGIVPTWTSWIGGSVVVASVTWGSMQKGEREQQREDNYSMVPAEQLGLGGETSDGSDVDRPRRENGQ